MLSFLRGLLSSDSFMPQGHYYLWRSDIMWLNIGSDLAITFAYYAISFALIYLLWKRKDFAFRWIFVMVALSIISSGTTHLIEIVTLWHPFYGVQGLVKMFTAGISIATAIAVWPLMPKAIRYPSPLELEQKNVELQTLNEQLRQSSKSRLRQVIEAAPNGLLMVDQRGTIVLCNAEIESLFGYQREELLGTTIEILVPQNARQKHPNYRMNYFANPETRQMGAGRDLTGLRKNGTEFPVEIGLNPVQTDEGQFVLASIVDITERKTIEKRLHEAIAARDEFMSIASHELKTPLTSLSLQIQMAKQTIAGKLIRPLSTENLAKTLDLSEKQVSRLVYLIDDLLDFTRIRTGKFSFTFEELNLSQVVREMIIRFYDEFTHSNMAYTVDIDEDIIGRFDHVRIEQLMDNLLSNAIKYAPNHPVKVSLKRRKHFTTLTVEDHGPGIPADKQATLFDRFERATTSDNIGGLGLGLFIAKEIVHGHSGSIHLESTLGIGSKFIVDFPLDTQRTSVQS